MIWQKEFGSANNKSIEYLLAAIVVLVVIGFIFTRPILFIVIGVFVAYILINYFYDKKIGEKLELDNPRTTLRLFQGEDAELTFELQNRSIFPIVNGEFNFQTDSSIVATEYVDSSNKYWNQYILPLSVIGRGKVTITLPIKAEQRGVSRVKNIMYRFPHLFNFGTLTLKYAPFYHSEFIVLPKPIPIQGIETISYATPGSQRINFSPYEDVQSPMGTRDYSYGDPFHRINWKASAKTQGLQTNVYDNVVDMSYVFIVNIASVKSKINIGQYNKNMEELLSYTAYLCQYAAEAGVSFELFINARKPGKIPYIHMPEGEGKTHYARSMEMLARIHRMPMTVQFNQMLYRAGQQFEKPKTIIIIGEIHSDAEKVIEKWKYKQKRIFHVEKTEDGAVMKPWTKDVMQHAK